MPVRGGALEVSGNSRTSAAVDARHDRGVIGQPPADAIILGGGLVGLCCAAAIARHGGRTILLDEERPGAASRAAAGMLAPSIERGNGPATDFAIAARDHYPEFLRWLEDETGVHVPLNRRGILQLALSEAGVRGLRRAMARDADTSAEWLDEAAVRSLEPELAHALGAVFHPRDGAVDNVVLLAALSAWCRANRLVEHVTSAAVRIADEADGATVRASDGRSWRARFVVLAGGAWAPVLEGLPRSLPITPLRGQMLAYAGLRLQHVVFGPRGYIVPRAASPAGAAVAEILVGATSEAAGFDSSTTRRAHETLRSAGVEILPALRSQSPLRQWAGLRPMTPDLLPIIGPDPERPSLLYACGHSRNGVSMAPLTGECLAAIVRGAPTPHDLQPFSITRFTSA